MENTPIEYGIRIVLSFNESGIVQLHRAENDRGFADRLCDESFGITPKRVLFDTQECIDGVREAEDYQFEEKDLQSPGAFLARWTGRKSGEAFSDKEVAKILEPLKEYGGILFVLNGDRPHLDYTFQETIRPYFLMNDNHPPQLSYRSISLYRCLANFESGEVRELLGRTVAGSFEDEIYEKLGARFVGMFSTTAIQEAIARSVNRRFERYEAARLAFGDMEHFEKFFGFGEIQDMLLRLQQASEGAIAVHITPKKENIESWNIIPLPGIIKPCYKPVLRHTLALISSGLTQGIQVREHEEEILLSLSSSSVRVKDKKLFKLILEVIDRAVALRDFAEREGQELAGEII